MLEKANNKISVLNKMIGLGEEVDSSYIVPQNSITHLQQKLGLSEIETMENSTRNLKTKGSKCLHCENMAKNFLYLESLIRRNYNANNNCNVCHSSLQYLQYVNKNIMEVFGNFDAIVPAANAFGKAIKAKPKIIKHQTPRLAKIKSTSNHSHSKHVTTHFMQKHSVISKIPSVYKNAKKVPVSHLTLQDSGHKKKNVIKKPKFKLSTNINSRQRAGKSSSLENAPKEVTAQKPKTFKAKTKKLLSKLKSKKLTAGNF